MTTTETEARPKARCSVCRTLRRLTKNGVVGKHPRGGDHFAPTCRGSLLPPLQET